MEKHNNGAEVAGGSFRGDIEGLRALAALLVAIFHIWMNKVSGGVDVFFVVSGYLITLSLLRQHEQEGRVRPVIFWAGLARRLLPSALLVIAAVLVGTWLLLPRSLWMSSMKESLAAMFYLENWLLALNSVDYLARDNLPSPVQHYWALSAQGQFYALWPFVIMLALCVSSWLAMSRRRALLLTFAGVFIVSLMFSVMHTAANQTFAYFNTFARVWQFALGGLMAVTPWVAVDRDIRRLMGWLGLAAVISCGFVLDVSLSFPGYAALWPSLGAALVLAAGADTVSGSARALLSARPLLWLGGISYAFYLWHWPVMIFLRATFGELAVAWYGGVAIMLLSLLLAYGTTRLVETPLRAQLGRRSPGFAYAAAVVAVAPLVLVILLWRNDVREMTEDYRVPDIVDATRYPGARALAEADLQHAAADGDIIPEPFMASRDVPKPYREGCHQNLYGTEATPCNYGHADGALTIAVAGSSHATHWVPALDDLAEQRHWRLVSYTKNGCRFTALADESPDNRENSCALWNDNVLEAIEQLEPDFVFTTGTVAATDTRPEHMPEGYVQQWQKLGAMGRKILAVRDTPFMGFHVPTCVDMNGADSPLCSRPRDAALEPALALDQLSRTGEHVHFIDMSNYFCTVDICPAVAGNILIYKDKSHISTVYMKSLSSFLAQAIDRAMQPRTDRRLAERHETTLGL
ncbi:Peptidoglycan/LPS O-acetylase OafA/YrhL, contains acyltransferase and SGNH-hydrolase domains [Halopseudomonas litoralis]|uniref:Peptidoglycan/LPS O-acetylase OafA/YrhL, contains acyltransferase and SGNH-hydrolase domains n=1 Tax=Halopseudomonas litoralis TaxID=797277 RepID=A0A1H1P6T8_9GAMM|nr:acyltransferase family protein [Halopseudomonas litoralis]SDS06902.1 Peptidoglycan/LPS O-acetylase OafA/YrhL, contains acyltransferase and SGNH-hydrolase domains [Halopseudomonas litoralis]